MDFLQIMETNLMKIKQIPVKNFLTVVKTCVLPKLVYPFAVLPKPSESIIKDIRKKKHYMGKQTR